MRSIRTPVQLIDVAESQMKQARCKTKIRTYSKFPRRNSDPSTWFVVTVFGGFPSSPPRGLGNLGGSRVQKRLRNPPTHHWLWEKSAGMHKWDHHKSCWWHFTTSTPHTEVTLLFVSFVSFKHSCLNLFKYLSESKGNICVWKLVIPVKRENAVKDPTIQHKRFNWVCLFCLHDLYMQQCLTLAIQQRIYFFWAHSKKKKLTSLSIKPYHLWWN